MSYTKYDGTPAAETASYTRSFGSSGAETLAGTSGSDVFWMSTGDKAAGGAGDDLYVVQADPRSFTITEGAGQGIDKIEAWQNINLEQFANVENLKVSTDASSIVYAAGNALDNIIEGGDGSQQIYGGLGQDILIGGAGRDTFIIYKGEGNDVVQDFNGAEDLVRLKAGFTTFDQVKAAMSQVGSDVKIDLGGGDGVIFRNTTISSFSASNFQLQMDTSKLGGQTFGDEFNGPLSIWDPESNPTGTWRPDLGYQGSQGYGSYTLAGNNELQIYTSPYFRDHPGDFAESPFVSNADGTLSIWAKPSNNSEIFGFHYTSGLITSKESFTQTYGYFEMRADLPTAAGAWPAFWLIPADGSWPPELDVMETLTKDPWASYTTEHSGVGGHSSNGQMNFTPGDGMHTYGVLWTQTDLVWYYDGVEVFHTATPADMNKPMFVMANMALGGWGGAVDNSQLPAEFKIDYIRAWSLGSATGSGTSTSPPPPVAVSPPPPAASSPPPPPPPPSVVVNADGSMILYSPGDHATLTGGAGADTIYASQGYDVLTGGGSGDKFVFANEPWAPITIKDFQLGMDKLDLSALFTAAGYAGVDPVGAGYMRFQADGANTLLLWDRDAAGTAQQWPNYIIKLENVATGGLTWEQLSGQPLSPPPPPPPPPNLVLTSPGTYATLTGGAGDDTIYASQGYDVLTGGAGADKFVFAKEPWAPIDIKDFKLGVDTLDLSALFKASGYRGVDPVADKYIALTPDGAGGTKVLFDRDSTGSGQKSAAYIVQLEGAPTSGLTWAKLSGALSLASSKAGGDVLVGGSGVDTLTAGLGPDLMTGGAGADRFVFSKLPTTAGHITDFQHADDYLDLRGLFKAAGYKGSNPVADGYLKIVSDGADGSVVMFDQDGKAAAFGWKAITTLDHVNPSTLTSADWLFR